MTRNSSPTAVSGWAATLWPRFGPESPMTFVQRTRKIRFSSQKGFRKTIFQSNVVSTLPVERFL
jgi:hypothetical protein